MADGSKVGEGYIEVGLDLDDKAIKDAVDKTREAIAKMAKAARDEWARQRKDLIGGRRGELEAFLDGDTRSIFARQRAEMKAAAQLDQQRQTALAEQRRRAESQRKRQLDILRRDTSAILAVEKMKNAALAAQQKSAIELDKAHTQALAENAKRDLAMEKIHTQALAENARRDLAMQKLHVSALNENRKRDNRDRELALKRAIEIEKAHFQALREEQKRQEAMGRAHTLALLENQRRDDKARAEADKIARERREAPGRALDRLAGSLSQLSTRIGIASFQAQMLGVMLHQSITAPVIQGFAQLSQSGLQFAVHVGYARASLEALLGPAADVETILNDIKRITIESPLFDADNAIQYAQQLAANGVKGKDLVRTMQAMSNIFLTQGVAGPERATLAMLAYTQILSKGKIGMDDLRQQFAEHVPGGIKIFEEVARRMGFKTLKALNTALEKGKVTVVDLNEAFIKFGHTERFLKGAEGAAETLGGVWQGFTEDIVTRVGTAFDKNRVEIIRAINGIRPVVMAFIDWFVAAIPRALDAINRMIDRVRAWKDQYDQLNPEQQRLIQNLAWLTLALGPAAVAIGVLGTALSAVVNMSSLLTKVLSIAAGGTTLGVLGTIGLAVAAAIMAIGAAMAYAYRVSEPFRDAFLKVGNLLKDIVSDLWLPLIDYIWMRLQQLGAMLESVGFKTEWFAYVMLLAAGPMVGLALTLGAVAIALEIARFALLAIIAVVDLASEVVKALMLVVVDLLRLLALIPGLSGPLTTAANAVEKAAESVGRWISIRSAWDALKTDTGVDKNATDDLQEKLRGLDLTAVGIKGAFEEFGISLDGVTQKEIELADAVENARKAMQLQNNEAAAGVDASDNYNRTKLALIQSIKQHKKTLEDDTYAGLQNRSALKAATQASYERMLQDIKSGKPMWEAINRHRERTKALAAEFGKNKEVQAEAKRLIDTYGKVPKDVRTLLEIMGYKDVDAKLIDILAKQRVAKNPTLSYSAARAALEKQSRIKAATGGLIRGPGGPTADRIPAMLSDHEYVIRAAAVRGIGTGVLDYINAYGTLPARFARGGVVTWPFSVDASKSHVPNTIGGPGGGGGMGVARMMNLLRGAFPGLALLSGYREGAITSTGNRSYHALNRAVDLPPRWDVFSWIRENYGRSTKELIFTPAGGLQIQNGRDHVYTGGTIQRDHFNHIHWAYDNGGYIPPGVPFVNSSNTAELALNAAQGRALEERIRNSDRAVSVAVYVDGVRRDAEIVWNEKADELARLLGGDV